MAIQWKRNTRYPSVTRPGVFPRIQELDDQGNDILEDTWFELTGIDEEEMNKFKFALGTWTQISKRSRKIRILSPEAVNNVTYPITDDSEDSGTTEPKPDTQPAGFLNNLTPYQWAKSKTEDDKLVVEQEGGYSRKVTEDNGDKNYYVRKSDDTFSTFKNSLGNKVTKNLKEHSAIKWHSKTFETINFRAPLAGPGGHHISIGEKTEDRAWVCYKRETRNRFLGVDYEYKWKPNLADPHWAEDNKLGVPSAGFQWVWQPINSIDKITDPVTGLQSHGEWVEGGSLIETQNQAESDNQYVGLVTKTSKEFVEDIEQEDLFLYHEIDSDDYKDTSAPLEVYFSLNYLERDSDSDRSTDVIKYNVIEWGDEEDQMNDQEILNSEFFYLYENDDSVFDGTKYKKLCLIAAEAERVGDADMGSGGSVERGKLYNHVYIEPGVKTIKTIVMRFDESETFLLETSIVHTNIFVADPNQKIQDFNIFGGEDFSVLPIEEELESIIGNVDKESEYVRSIKKIRDNDLYQATDYLEKLYADDFLPKVNQDLYGEYAGNIDLGITRVFKKTYNIFDFIGGDALEIINNNFEYSPDSLPLNSSATEILIDDGDCVVELNPSNQNNDQVENTGVSDEKGLLMGDFRLVKNPKQKIRKEDAMQIPRLNTQKKRQAF
jgi:hypothetical protein